MGKLTCNMCFISFPSKAVKYDKRIDKYYCPDCYEKLEAAGELDCQNLLESLNEDDIKGGLND
ncbi:MAG TPA: hypothetical protein ACFYEK_11050 [Candidatus Wunengus sp. YC60]|uniref:hypothetical protein n=1 Tax=Candidatus Wunengus sp. YC60 TaxID=3367697 RepID=UPI0040296690